MELMVWTVNDPKDIEWFIAQGFDYILTDDPVMMRSVLEKSKKR
jgi:glycerophosphoryl diester phosphodiesterase